MEAQPKLRHGLPLRAWKGKRPPHVEKAMPKLDESMREHRQAAIRFLADQLAEQFSDEGRIVSARQVLDLLESLWPKECKARLAKGRE